MFSTRENLINNVLFYFNLLMQNINFHVHFWLLPSKRTFQGLFETKGTSTKNKQWEVVLHVART